MYVFQMGYTLPTVATSLRVNYERFLYPYELFLVKQGKLEVRGWYGKVAPSACCLCCVKVGLFNGVCVMKNHHKMWCGVLGCPSHQGIKTLKGYGFL